MLATGPDEQQNGYDEYLENQGCRQDANDRYCCPEYRSD
jgi:hypothetical protein